MSNLFKKVTSATMALLIVLSIVSPFSGVMAAYTTLEAANKLASLWVIVDNSTNPANYRLGDSITRGEMAKVTMKLSEADVAEVCEWKYSDLVAADWACKYAEAGLANGFFAANPTFRPMDVVTKVEALKMVMQARGIAKSSNADWMAAYVEAAVEAGVLDASFTDYNSVAQRGWIFQLAVNAIEGMTDEGDDLLGDLLGDLDDEDTDTTTDTGSTVVTGNGELTVSLSPETPAGATVPGNISGLPVAKFDFTAGDEDVTVTSLIVKRRGLSDKETLSGLAAFTDDGRASKAKDDSQENDTEATLTLTNGLVIKAGETKTITIVADVRTALTIATPNANWDEFSIELKEVTADGSVETEWTLVGNTMRVGWVDAAAITLKNNGSVSNPKLGDEGADIFKFQIKWASDEDVVLKSITFKADSSDAEDDLMNFKLLQGTTEVAATTMMNGKYLTFTFIDGITIWEDKTEKFTVKADVIAWADDELSFSVDKKLDVTAVGTKYGFWAAVNVNEWVALWDAITIQAWELTLVDIDPSSDKMREGKDDVILGKLAVTNVSGWNLELQQFWVKVTLDDGKATVASVPLTLATLFENFELVNEDTWAAFELTLPTGGDVYSDTDLDVYSDTDLSVTIPQGTTNFAIRADTKSDIANFDTASVTLSLDSGKLSSHTPATGAFYVVETEDDTEVTDLSPSTLSWKKVEGTESSATVSVVPLSTVTKVRGSKDVVIMQFEVEADESSDLTMDEAKVFITTSTWGVANNQKISEVALYKGSVLDSNLLDRVSGSNLASWTGTFDWFNVSIAANAKQTFVVTVSVVDWADALSTAVGDYSARLDSISLEDDDNDDITAAGMPVTSARLITVTDFGSVALTEDVNNDDNEDDKTILAWTSKTVFSMDTQATNENVKVETVTFYVNQNIKNAVTTATLYLGDSSIATNSNSDISSTLTTWSWYAVTFKNLTNLEIPQETKELKLALNTANIGFEKVGETLTGVTVDYVKFSDASWKDSGKDIADVATAVTALTAKDIAIVPATVTPSLVSTLSSGQAKLKITMNAGSNTIDLNNSTPSILLTSLAFSELGNNTTGYKIYKEGQSARQGTISPAWVFASWTMSTPDLTISSATTYVIIPNGLVDETYTLNLTKDGIVYDVNWVALSTWLTSNLTTELELGTKSY